MKYSVEAQSSASELLKSEPTRAMAHAPQSSASQLIDTVIQLLLGNSSSSANDQDPSEYYEEDYEDLEGGEYSEGQSDSQTSSGDFIGNTSMQALPVPNYSAEEILKEERDNLQFRQQRRSSSNAGKVEKDY